MNTEEIMNIKGEPHFVQPHRFDGGNSVRCSGCRYYAADEKTKDPRVWTGRCVSRAAETDRTHIFTERTADVYSCQWWFPTEPLGTLF